jgi:hypothetical protein
VLDATAEECADGASSVPGFPWQVTKDAMSNYFTANCRRCDGTGKLTCRKCRGYGFLRSTPENRVNAFSSGLDDLDSLQVGRHRPSRPPRITGDGAKPWPRFACGAAVLGGARCHSHLPHAVTDSHTLSNGNGGVGVAGVHVLFQERRCVHMPAVQGQAQVLAQRAQL